MCESDVRTLAKNGIIHWYEITGSSFTDKNHSLLEI